MESITVTFLNSRLNIFAVNLHRRRVILLVFMQNNTPVYAIASWSLQHVNIPTLARLDRCLLILVLVLILFLLFGLIVIVVVKV